MLTMSLVICFLGLGVVSSSRFCSDGTTASLHDKGICCPGTCRVCDEVQCLSRHYECCPGAIYKSKRQCLAGNDTACIFDRDAVHGRAEALGKQLVISRDFCALGKPVMGSSHAVCCAKGDCRPSEIVKSGAVCSHASNVSCAVRRREFETSDFRHRGSPSKDRVHVVVAGDRVQSLGVLASARSVFQSTTNPERVTVHAIVDPMSTSLIQRSFRCLSQRDRILGQFFVYAFDVKSYALEIRAPVNEHKGNLAAGANFARFYLRSILPNDVQKVVYLDADTVVLKDIAVLYDGSLLDDDPPPSVSSPGGATTPTTPPRRGGRPPAVAAVSRRYKPMCGSFINCKSPEVRLLLRSQDIYDPEAELDAFNAGIMVISLDRWERYGLTKKVEYWIGWNADLPVYKLGSNPPLVLAVRDNFEHMDPRWNCQRGHVCWDRGDAGALHWSGANKPWNLDYQRDTIEWLPFLRGTLADGTLAKCLTGLPKPGQDTKQQRKQEIVASIGDTMPLLSQRIGGMLGFSSKPKSPPMEATNDVADLSRGRERLAQLEDANSEVSAKFLAAAHDLSWRVGNASSLEAAIQMAPALRDAAVLERAEASLRLWPRMTSVQQLAESLTEMMTSLESAFMTAVDADDTDAVCDYLLVAIQKNQLYVDVSRNGRGKPCGIASSSLASASLEYLAGLLDMGLLKTKDVAFLLCVSPNGPLISTAPVLTHAMLRQGIQGILVPGPQHMTQRYDDDDSRSGGWRSALGDVTGWVKNRFDAVNRASGINLTTSGAFSIDDTKWMQRHDRAGWRGRIESDFSCTDVGSWARLEAAALTLAYPGISDARFTRSLQLSEDRAARCQGRATASPTHARFLRRIIAKRNIGTARPTPHLIHQLLRYRYVFSIPQGKGCPDTTTASLFSLGAAILAWETPCTSWYDPALNGTLLYVNMETSVPIITLLQEHPVVAKYLGIRARQFSDNILCPSCVGKFWSHLLERYHDRFIGSDSSDDDIIQVLTRIGNANFVLHTEDTPAWMSMAMASRDRF